MANTVSVQVADLSLVLVTYDRIKIYRANVIDGAYSEITNSSTRIVLNTQDTLYKYIDTGGASTHFYKTAYFHSISLVESQLSDAVAAVTITDQLLQNMQVVITLSKNIKNTSGVSLGEQVFFFTTTYNPLYSSVRKVRLEIGSFIYSIDDDAVNLAIFEASLAADQLTWVKPSSGNKFFQWARREWVTCKASQSVLGNVISGLKSKRLDNMEVVYDDIKRGQLMLDKTAMCLARWEAELRSGGSAVQKPMGFVKGEANLEDAHVGRMWEKGPGVQKIAAANARYRPFGRRRYISGWRKMF